MHVTDEHKCVFKAADGVDIIGILRAPVGATRGTFLLLHGISTGKNEYLNFLGMIAGRLADNGFSSLRIDFRGHGESPVPPDGFTVGTQIIDVQAAIRFLQKEM